MIVSLEKLVHAVFIGEITQLGNFFKGKSGSCCQLLDFLKLLSIYGFLQRLARFRDEYSVKVSFADIKLLRNIGRAYAYPAMVGDKSLYLHDPCLIFAQ